jgi:putative ABC transport system permease protein
LVVQPFFHTLDGGRENVLVRGVEPVALQVHRDVRITAGRMFTPSSGEAVVGKGVMGRYRGAALGNELEFGHRRWTVVGILDGGGSSFESEVWVDVRELGNDAKRTFPYSGIRLRAADGYDMGALKRRIDDDPRFALEAQPEADYYAKQAESANALYILVIGIAVLAGIGAGFGAANTMYAAVQTRTAEIGTLRAIGFSRGSILWSFQVEALALAGIGFALGAVLRPARAPDPACCSAGSLSAPVRSPPTSSPSASRPRTSSPPWRWPCSSDWPGWPGLARPRAAAQSEALRKA